MWKIRFLMVSSVLVGSLIFGLAAVHGFWWWNAKIDVEGTMVQTVWAVDNRTGAVDYQASITMELPADAAAKFIHDTLFEIFTLLRSSQLSCLSNGVETNVTFLVEPGEDSVGTRVHVALMTKGRRVLTEGSGLVGEPIHLSAIIPAHHPDCWDGEKGEKKDKKVKKHK